MARGESQDWLSLGWIVSYPLLAVVAAMIFLSAEEMVQPGRDPTAVVATITDSPTWSADFPARVEALHLRVMDAPLGAHVAREDQQGAGALRWTHRVLELTVDPGRRAEVEAVIASLRDLDPGVTLVSEDRFNGTQVIVGLDGLLTHTIRIYWTDEPVRPRVGLVVTALGDDLQLAREVISLDAPVAVAIQPFRPFSAQVAELAKIFEREVLLDWSGGAQRHGLEAALATVPGAVGLTLESSEADEGVVTEAREHGLWVVRAGIEAAGSRVVEMPLEDGTLEAFDSVTRRARSGGAAIGLTDGAPSREGVSKVRGFLSRWEKEEIDVVKVSQLLAPPST
jgi:hypothetical protein